MCKGILLFTEVCVLFYVTLTLLQTTLKMQCMIKHGEAFILGPLTYSVMRFMCDIFCVIFTNCMVA